jgi:hypothetical protein
MMCRKRVLFCALLVLVLGFLPYLAADEVPAATPPTISIDKAVVSNGGEILVSGQAPAGKDVYLEVWSERTVRASFFDASKDLRTGSIPYRLYLSNQIPAHYRIYLPVERAEALKRARAEGSRWAYSRWLNDTGASAAYSVPGKVGIDVYQSSLMSSVVGSRGPKLPPLDAGANRQRSMQLIKARFRSADKLLSPAVQIKPDGSFTAKVLLPAGAAPGKYYIAAVVDKSSRSQPVSVENSIAFPMVYLPNAGTSVNLILPFLLSLAISIFGVLMGAGGGFILNPLLISLWPLPHTIVAGTVMPTVLFSQGSGIQSYARIKFINWRLGVTLGMCMLVGGFIGPKLTEMITLDQFKFVFGWILMILAALMLWQTTPAYLAKNKKEQAILKEFKSRAEATQKKKAAAKGGA